MTVQSTSNSITSVTKASPFKDSTTDRSTFTAVCCYLTGGPRINVSNSIWVPQCPLPIQFMINNVANSNQLIDLMPNVYS
jgi:hypothetical protein